MGYNIARLLFLYCTVQSVLPRRVELYIHAAVVASKQMYEHSC